MTRLRLGVSLMTNSSPASTPRNYTIRKRSSRKYSLAMSILQIPNPDRRNRGHRQRHGGRSWHRHCARNRQGHGVHGGVPIHGDLRSSSGAMGSTSRASGRSTAVKVAATRGNSLRCAVVQTRCNEVGTDIPILKQARSRVPRNCLASSFICGCCSAFFDHLRVRDESCFRYRQDCGCTRLSACRLLSSSYRRWLLVSSYLQLTSHVRSMRRESPEWHDGFRRLASQFPTITSTFFIIKVAHWTAAAIILSVRGLPCGPPNRSSTRSRCRAMRIPAMIPITRLRSSSVPIRSMIHLSLFRRCGFVLLSRRSQCRESRK